MPAAWRPSSEIHQGILSPRGRYKGAEAHRHKGENDASRDIALSL
jgi:hypothetical protein